MNKYFLILLVALTYVSCNINEPAEVLPVPPKLVPSSPQVTYDNLGSIVLEWQCDNPTLALSIEETPPVIGQAPLVFKPTASSRKFTVPGLTIGVSYNWQVEVRISSDSTLKGPVWNFVYQPGGHNKEGFIFNELSSQKVFPHVIDLRFQVTDLYSQGVVGLTVNDFNIFENGEPVSVSESKSSLINSPIDKYESKIIILLDVSTSIQNTEISKIKTAATDFVNGISGDLSAGHKKIAVYKFSTALEQVLDYSSIQGDVIAAISSISSQWSTTNLYGAVTDAAELMEDKISSAEAVKHVMVVFTDGADTQGSTPYSDALKAVNGKTVFTVGIGNEIDEKVLAAIGVSGFYRIDNSNTQLTNGIEKAQTELEDFVNSFYRLKYRSPKRGPVNHELAVNLKVNPFGGLNSNLVFNFNSAEFFDAAAGLYINSGITNPTGIDSVFLAPNQEKIITASGYLLDNDSDLNWTAPVAHPGRAFVIGAPQDNSKALVRAGSAPWVTRFNLTDNNNSGYSKTIYIVIR